MHIITGATGHVGSSVIKSLLAKGEKVLAVTHSLLHIPKLKLLGAETAYVDIRDVNKLRETFNKGETLFMLNPPGDITKDAVTEEKETVACLLQALAGSNIKRIVAESVSAAQKGEAIGDLGVLYDMEQGIFQSERPARITRAGYYMSNWDMQAESAKKNGVIQSFFPADFKLPQVAPQDLGEFNARCLTEQFTDTKITNVSGPQDTSAQDVANEFSRIFNRDVKVEVIPPEKWSEAYQQQGFSKVSAESYTNMTRITVNRDYQMTGDTYRGPTSLREYFEQQFGQQNSQPSAQL